MLLTDHKFNRKLIQDIVFYKQHDQNSLQRLYCQQVMGDFAKIKKVLKDLVMARQLIAALHHDSGVPPHPNISREMQLKYHIENFFLKITTYKDLVLKLIDAVYIWKLPRGANGFENMLLKCADKQGVEGIKTIVENLKILFSTVKVIRNKIAHEGSLNNVDVELLEIHKGIKEMLDENPVLKAKGPQLLPSDVIDEYLGITIIGNLSEIQKIEEDLATNLLSNLDFLYEKFCENAGEDHPFC
ncbi:hypothetical protein DHW03_01650 [Pedobacter yonginense]|uniref:Uncharacterized protein n=1 Tax=Pedobacter yonginense TaxID=651869 RepID=A0A317ERV8_9SPHI|nr:Cthe_2314 family HEPN domain-containing protein [Pedobacter yonginense]PWS28583.1 hypothetical protein DHW03_01650 [Pedobacter yonginense]